MSKKQKRNTYQGARRSTPAQPADTSSTPVSESPTRPSSSPTRSFSPTRSSGSYSGTGSRRFMPAPEFKPDYSYVTRDLKRIGILAGSFLGILIVLSFFLK